MKNKLLFELKKTTNGTVLVVCYCTDVDNKDFVVYIKKNGDIKVEELSVFKDSLV